MFQSVPCLKLIPLHPVEILSSEKGKHILHVFTSINKGLILMIHNRMFESIDNPVALVGLLKPKSQDSAI